MKSNKHITVFEHESLKLNSGRINDLQLKSLQEFYGEKGCPYFSLIHNGVKFNEHVGVIQVGPTIIEILPKIDQEINEESWRDVLIGMLHTVGELNTQAPTSSNLELKSNTILHLYFKIFITEVEQLVRRGLIKKYHKTENNEFTLKGRLVFNKHIHKNLIHKERFYVNYNTYNKKHILNQILLKTLLLLNQINNEPVLNQKISNLLLVFPELQDIKVSNQTFLKIKYDRKSECYKNAINISKLILLNYHPDIKLGRNNVLALMFNMNILWEKFIISSIKKHKEYNTKIKGQDKKYFWQAKNGNRSKMIPDIIVENEEKCLVLDTKWKNIHGDNPSSNDLRQMYVYMNYYEADKVALLYPDKINQKRNGFYYNEKTGKLGEKECCIMTFTVEKSIRDWQKNIYNQLQQWMNE